MAWHMLLQGHFSSPYFRSIFCLLRMPDPKQHCCVLLHLGIAPKAKSFLFTKFSFPDLISDHVYEIVTCVFQYLEMLRRQEPLEWIFKEYQVQI